MATLTHPHTSMIDAVETLSNIADMEIDTNVGITEDHQLTIADNKLKYLTVHWLNQEEAPYTVALIREQFKHVLSYLHNFYRRDYDQVTDPQAAEGIKTIMVLVGEAAKKLDKYSAIFQEAQVNASELQEYKSLQEFYLSRIAHTIDEGILGKWILALSQGILKKKKPLKLPTVSGEKPQLTKHVFVDLESVKRDTEYELFFLRKEDGTRFFSPRLIRNIKLVTDFGNYFGNTKVEDPLQDLPVILDRSVQHSAKSLIRTLGPVIDRFYREGLVYRQNELVELVNKAILALMLSANANNLRKNDPPKCCMEYFVDFQRFLREAVQSREYQKMISYQPGKGSVFSACLVDTVHAICHGFYLSMQGVNELSSTVDNWVETAKVESPVETPKELAQSLSHHIGKNYNAMSKWVKKHSNGPLIKVLHALEKGYYHFYDPSYQHNLPSQLYSIYSNDQKITNLHIPSPTYQEYINKASVNEEFKGMLRSMNANYMMVSKGLFINVQDRTSWKDHFRCAVVEDLQKSHMFEKNVTVVTINHDTEFYHQLAPYHEENRVEDFIGHFKEHLSDETSGFFYPKNIKKALFPGFVDPMLKDVHAIFFGGKNVLSRERRMDFIEIFYLFLELKLLDLVKPDWFCFSCKDGIDVASTSNVLLFVFMKWMESDEWTDQDTTAINSILYAPVLLVRERLIQSDRFNRMIATLKVIEEVRNDLGPKEFRKMILHTFGKYFDTPILKGKLEKVK